MKIEVGEYYKTRDGLKARIYAVDGNKPDTIHGAVFTDSGWIFNVWEDFRLRKRAYIDITGFFDYVR